MMLKFLKRLILIVAIILIATKVVISVAVFVYPRVIPPDEEMAVSAQELVDLTNEYRRGLGLEPLQQNFRLQQAALNKARDLLAEQYFSHTSPDGKRFSQWIKDVNYNYFYVGENLAIDFDNNQAVFEAWLNSPSHKENITKPQYQEIGVAALKGKFKNRPTIVVVQLFGTRILGAKGPDFTNNNLPLDNPAYNYFSQQELWQKYFSLEGLEKMNRWNNYLIMVFVGLCLILYVPQKKINQINIKQPIINRYQAKIFRE